MSTENKELGVPASPSLSGPADLSPASGSSQGAIANAISRKGTIYGSLLAAGEMLADMGQSDFVEAAESEDGELILSALVGLCFNAADEVENLIEALDEMIELARPNVYPQPDKPDSPYAKLERALAAIRKARGEQP